MANKGQKSLSTNALFLSSGNILVQLSNILIAAILARSLTINDYAQFRMVYVIYLLFLPILQLGLPNALYYFLPQSENRGRQYLTGNLLLLFSSGLIFFIFIWLGGSNLLADLYKNQDISYLLRLFSLYFIFTLPVLSVGATLVTQGKIKSLILYNVLSKFLILIAVVGLVYLYHSASSALLGYVIAAGLTFIPSILLMYRSVHGVNLIPTWNIIKEQISYSVPLGVATMMGSITRNLDKAILAGMATSEEFAIYTNGAIEIPFIGIVISSITSVLIPEFVRYYKDKKYSDMVNLWTEIITRMSILIFPVFVFLFFTAPKVMVLLYSEKYIEATIPFRVYLLILPVRVAIYGSIFMSSGNNRLILNRSIVEIVLNILLTYICVSIFGYLGAAIAIIVVLYFWTMPYNIFHIRRILNTSYSAVFPLMDMGKILIIALCSSVIFLIPSSTLVLSPVVYLIINGILYFLLFYIVMRYTKFAKYIDLRYYYNLILRR